MLRSLQGTMDENQTLTAVWIISITSSRAGTQATDRTGCKHVAVPEMSAVFASTLLIIK